MRLFLIAGLRTVFFLYLHLLLVHSLLQHRYASEHERARRSPGHLPLTDAPSVDVLVPCYNEDPGLLEACCASLAGQDYKGILRIFLIDDGSLNLEDLLPIYRHHQCLALKPDQGPQWEVLLLPEHVGKRRAQDKAWQQGDGELVMTIDSDTRVAPNGISTMVSAFLDERVGAVAGRVAVHNASSNRLTRTTEQLYWLLFEQERAAQGRFRSVLCCAGPLSLYRRSALHRRWGDYLDQTVRGAPCISGDDLHLTTLILTDGYLALYEPAAVANTQVPSTLGHFLRQQLRWKRSFYRQLGWTHPAIRCRHWYLTFDVVARGLPPVLLGAALVLVAAEGILIGPGTGLRDLSLVGTLVLAYGTFAAGQARDLGYFYAGLLKALLVPLGLYALLTCTRTRSLSWNRRERRCLPKRPCLTGHPQ